MSARAIRRSHEREAAREKKRSSRLRKAAVAAGAGLGATVLFAPAAEAATFTVTNLNDSGDGSLRDAIQDANAAAGADTVVFQSGLSGTITLASEIPITDAVEVQGPGADVITVSGNDASRIFNIATPSGGAFEPVTISGLTLTNGSSGGGAGGAVLSSDADLTISSVVVQDSDSGAGRGGGIAVEVGPFSLLDSTVSGNSADEGGGVMVDDAGAADDLVLLQNSVIRDNEATGEGGGVYLYDIESDVLIDRVSVTGNTAGYEGGGIYIEELYTNSGLDLTIRDTTVADNTTAGEGGGVYIQEGDPDYVDSIAIERTTIAGNTSASNGGGLLLDDEITIPVTLTNSTISGNSSAGDGGGIYDRINDSTYADARLEVENSTIVENTATGAGGGVFRYQDAPTISSSIVANNTSASSDLAEDAGADGAFVVGFSLIEDPGTATVTEDPPGSNITGQDPQLGPLQDNTGPTETHLPAETSPAIDAGVANGLATDQRGLARTFDQEDVPDASGSDGTDIGSTELQPLGVEVVCQGETVTSIEGTDGDDVLTGTPGVDAIFGRGGADVIEALPGNDCVFGEGGADDLRGDSGDDRLSGGGDADRIAGGPGNDRAVGNAGNDRVSGNAGRDRVNGSGGNDRVKGGGGNDRVRGGRGKDIVRGQGGKDRVAGRGGDDRLNGGEGSDRMNGGGGNDKIRGGAAKDRIKGGAGNDRINSVDNKRDRVNCGGGNNDKATVDERDKVSGNCEKVIVVESK